MTAQKTKSLGALSALLTALSWQFAAPCLAQSSPFSDQAPAPMPSELRWYKIPLQYTKTDDVMKIEYWDASNPDPKFPREVTKIVPLLDENALEAQATPDGFERAKDVLHELDHQPCVVQIKLDFVAFREMDEQASRTQASLNAAYLLTQNPIAIPTSDDNSLSQYCDYPSQRKAVTSALGNRKFIINAVSVSQTPVRILMEKSHLAPALVADAVRLTLGVRVNSDDTISLVLVPDHPPLPGQSSLTTVHTVRDNQKTFVGGFPWNENHYAQMFVTPTLLPDAPADSTNLGTPSEGGSQ